MCILDGKVSKIMEAIPMSKIHSHDELGTNESRKVLILCIKLIKFSLQINELTDVVGLTIIIVLCIIHTWTLFKKVFFSANL